MTFTNGEAFNSVQLLEGLKETGKLGYAIAKNLRRLKDELTEFYTKREELVHKYGTASDDGSYTIPKENVGAFVDELQEYGNMTFEYSPCKVSEDVFCGGNLTSDQMYVLDWMVDGGENLDHTG